MASKTRDGSVIPRSGVTTRLPPGTAAPRSSEPTGAREDRADAERAKTLPPKTGPGKTWNLVQPAPYKGKK